MIIGIGSKLWWFDQNRRKYTKPVKGNFWGKLIWREHWTPMVVVGETRVSWLIAREGSTRAAFKLPKSAFKGGACPRDWALSEEHVDELTWAEENRHELADAVRRCTDPKTLRAVWAALAAGVVAK